MRAVVGTKGLSADVRRPDLAYRAQFVRMDKQATSSGVRAGIPQMTTRSALAGPSVTPLRSMSFRARRVFQHRRIRVGAGNLRGDFAGKFGQGVEGGSLREPSERHRHDQRSFDAMP